MTDEVRSLPELGRAFDTMRDDVFQAIKETRQEMREGFARLDFLPRREYEREQQIKRDKFDQIDRRFENVDRRIHEEVSDLRTFVKEEVSAARKSQLQTVLYPILLLVLAAIVAIIVGSLGGGMTP